MSQNRARRDRNHRREAYRNRILNRGVHKRVLGRGESLLEDPEAAELVSYEITEEPMNDPLLDRLPVVDRNRIEELGMQVLEHEGDPALRVMELLELAKRYPHIPTLYNYLTSTYNDMGDHEKALAMTRETYERFPDYLFAIINYAITRIDEGHAHEVPGMLKNTFALHKLYPTRRQFHISEIIAYFGMLGIYFAEIDEPERAERYASILRELAPDHPFTRRVAARMHPSPLRLMMQAIGGLVDSQTKR